HPIGLRSRPGHGSVFWVTVPLAHGPAVEPVPTAALPGVSDAGDDPLADCVCWCIDDDPRVCEASRALLERWGCQVAFAGGPAAALAAVQHTPPPQVVLLDVRMGAHDGPTLYARLA